GGAHHADAIGALLDMPVDEFAQRVVVDTAVVVHGSDERDDAAAQEYIRTGHGVGVLAWSADSIDPGAPCTCSHCCNELPAAWAGRSVSGSPARPVSRMRWVLPGCTSAHRVAGMRSDDQPVQVVALGTRGLEELLLHLRRQRRLARQPP